MSDNLYNDDTNQEQIDGSIGAKLKRAREKLELSVQDIAKQLRLKPERIEALENDDYQEMANATFIKGYLRSYALLVNVPPEEILALFDQLKPIPEARLQPLISKTHSSSLQDKPIRWGVYLVGLTLLILVAIWWNSISAPDPSSSINPNTGMPQPIKNSPATGVTIPPAPSVMQTAPVPTTPTNIPTPTPTTPTQPTTTPSTTTPPAPAAGLPMGITPAAPEKKSSEQASSSANTDSATDASENDAATETKQPKSSRRNRDTQYYNDGYSNQSSSYSDGYDSYE